MDLGDFSFFKSNSNFRISTSSFRNASFSVTLRYLDFDTVARTDEVYYPRSAKKGIIYRDGRPNEFLRDGKPMDYYDGE